MTPRVISGFDLVAVGAIGGRRRGRRRRRAVATRLSRPVVAAADAAKILGIRAGHRSDHRFTGTWVVVVDGRVFARSWTVARDGWFSTFLQDSRGTIQVGDRQVAARARRVRGERLLDRIDEAYAAKYPTPGSRKYVRGFRTPRRRAATVEFVRR
jgi:hypothetical protein